ncbi:MAG: hypothetical protein ABJA16_01035 [Nakamurella sp.]
MTQPVQIPIEAARLPSHRPTACPAVSADVVLGHAFSGLAVPWHPTTVQ